jgi:hypothetical protein
MRCLRPFVVGVLALIALLGTVPTASVQTPGTPLPASSELSDQKLGSVLVYNYYNSDIRSPLQEDTEFTLTNTQATTGATVHLFFVSTASRRAASTFLTLGPRQTVHLRTSELDPNTTGYLIAVAVDDVTGCPIAFNHLAGVAEVRSLNLSIDATLPAQAIAAGFSGAVPFCNPGSTSADLQFNGVQYNRLPRVLAVDALRSLNEDLNPRLVINRIGGSLKPEDLVPTIGPVRGIVYDDVETGHGFLTNPLPSQAVLQLSNAFPRLAPPLDLVVPAGRSGWIRLFPTTPDVGVLGAIFHRRPHPAMIDAYDGAKNLHALKLTTTVTLTIPVTPPQPTADLAVSLTHDGDFNVGARGRYRLTVTNVGMKQAAGRITIYHQLPTGMSSAPSAGCTAGPDYFICQKTNGLMPGASQTFIVTVNVMPEAAGGGTATATVYHPDDANPDNDTANDPTTVLTRTPTSIQLQSSANPVAAASGSTAAVTLTATVSGSGGPPTGTVEFFFDSAGGASLGVVPLDAGAAMLATSFGVGTHTIRAVYSGNATFHQSETPLLQFVNLSPQIATTTTLSAGPNPTLIGNTVNLTATVSSGDMTPPTGTVRFFDGATLLGAATFTGAGNSISLTGVQLSSGVRQLTASYLGNTLLAPSVSPVFVQTILPFGTGPGIPSATEHGDDRPGSVLIYNVYTSSATSPGQRNTAIHLTNTHPTLSVLVYLYFVRGGSGTAARDFLTLAPNQTRRLLASAVDPGQTGYVAAVAVDGESGCPISFNHLIGNADVKLETGERATLAAVGFGALYSGTPANCGGGTAQIRFDGVDYNRLPRRLDLTGVASRVDGNVTRLIINRIGGDLTFGAAVAPLGMFGGTLYDPQANAVAWSTMSAGPQRMSELTNGFPETNPAFEDFLPGGVFGRLTVEGSAPGVGLLGAALDFNPEVNFSASALPGGRNLNGLALADPVTLTIPTPPIRFADVDSNDFFAPFIARLSVAGVTTGCGRDEQNRPIYCPNQAVTREQMAAFIMRALGEFNPPQPSMQRFEDVPPANFFYPFIDRLATVGVTTGCNSPTFTQYCPGNFVTREQMAAFLMRALGEFNPPQPAMQRFVDVPPANFFYPFIDRLAVLGITTGCNAPQFTQYCPASIVTRAQMAAFLVRAFGL